MTTKQSTPNHEKEIAACQAEIEKHNQQIREMQASINQLFLSPDIRARSLRDLESQLSRARINNETTLEQQKMYLGTDLEEVTTNDAIQSSARIRQLEKQIEEMRQHNTEQNSHDETRRAELEQQIERLFLGRDNLQNILSRIEREQAEKHYSEGKKVYQSCMADYQQRKQEVARLEEQRERAYQDLETHQFDILKKLDSYPELQRLFMQEHNVEVSDGTIRVAQAAVKYLEALISDHPDLQGVTTSDGRPLAEILSLTDQELMADYQGGLYNLQDKRAQLLDFVEQRKAMLQEPR